MFSCSMISISFLPEVRGLPFQVSAPVQYLNACGLAKGFFALQGKMPQQS